MRGRAFANQCRVVIAFLTVCHCFGTARGQVVLDQQQLTYNGGMSARTLPGYTVWQSFTAGASGTLVEIDMGFFNSMAGDGRLRIYSGEGTTGALLQTLSVSVGGIT